MASNPLANDAKALKYHHGVTLNKVMGVSTLLARIPTSLEFMEPNPQLASLLYLSLHLFSEVAMVFRPVAVTLAALPLLFLAVPVLAQASNPYANWIYLYEDTFQNGSGETITQQWWLKPDTIRRDSILEFALLARRTPVSSNGTAAAVFDYIADCSSMSYAIKKTVLLDSNYAVLDTQTTQRPMAPSNPDEPFYGILQNLCGS